MPAADAARVDCPRYPVAVWSFLTGSSPSEPFRSTSIAMGSMAQGFPAAADLGRDRADCRPLRGVLALVLEHHPYGSLLHLRRVALHCLLGFHGSILSRIGASGIPGAVQRIEGQRAGCQIKARRRLAKRLKSELDTQAITRDSECIVLVGELGLRRSMHPACIAVRLKPGEPGIDGSDQQVAL